MDINSVDANSSYFPIPPEAVQRVEPPAKPPEENSSQNAGLPAVENADNGRGTVIDTYA